MVESGSLYDVHTAWTDADGNGVKVSHLEPPNSIPTHSQNAVLPLQRHVPQRMV